VTGASAGAAPGTDGSGGVWAQVIGQPTVVEELRAAVADPAAMTHAWLFTGPPGSGRSVAARAFAAALQCPEGGDGTCHACRTVLAGTHADVQTVVPEGLSIGVAEVRELVRIAGRAPSQGRWQIVLVEDADRMTEQAANTVLKMLEEPPARTVFLLCAPSLHPDDVPVTIRSRCRVVGLRTPPVDAVAEVLIRRDGVDPALAAWSAAAAGGHVGRARRLARDEEARLVRKAVLDIPLSLVSLAACLDAAADLVGAAKEESDAAVAALDSAETEAVKASLGVGARGPGVAAATRGAGQLKELEKRQKSRATRLGRDSLDRALVDLAGLYRDALVLSATHGEASALNHPDRRADAEELARLIGPEGALRRIDAILDCRLALEQNVKPQIAVEALTVALRLPSDRSA
jgi:DNA polymerase-3 subunit delta'